MILRKVSPALAGLLVFLFSGIGVSHATHVTESYQAETQTYRLHLGVVSAQQLRALAQLGAEEKQIHGDVVAAPDMQHITVALYSRASDARVAHAHVVAHVKQLSFRGLVTDVELKPTQTSGVTTYEGFVRMPYAGKYRMTINVQEPGRRGETVSLVLKKHE